MSCINSSKNYKNIEKSNEKKIIIKTEEKIDNHINTTNMENFSIEEIKKENDLEENLIEKEKVKKNGFCQKFCCCFFKNKSENGQDN